MKLRLSKKVRSALIVTLLLLLLISGFLAAKTVSPGETDKKVPQYTYSQRAEVNYRAYLLPNSLYTEKTLNAGMVYVTPYVDYLNTYLAYRFEGQRAAEFSGEYEVRAIVEAADKDGKVKVWQREFPLIPKTAFASSGTTVTLEREMPIRVNDFNAFVNKIAEESKLNPQTIRLAVGWNINLEAKTDAGVIREQVTPTMVIPLGGRYFEVTGELSKSKPGVIEKTIKAVPPVNKRAASLYGGIFAISSLSLATLWLFTADQRDIDPMQQKLKQTLKTHADRLVAIDREIRAGSDQIMPVKSMEDLIRIADELSKPIIYEGKGSASASFYVLEGNKLFTYEFGSNGEGMDPFPTGPIRPARAFRQNASRTSGSSTGL